MKNVLVSCVVVVSSLVFAEAAKPMDPKMAPKADGKAEMAKAPEAAAMPMWKPRMVTKAADKKGVAAMYKMWDESMMKGDMNAVAGMIDFPVHMATDNAAGMPSGEMFTKEAWLSTMEASMGSMPKDMKLTRKPSVHFITDALAWVEIDNTMTVGKTKESWKSVDYVVLKDGKWMVKMMAEGGWGDVMAPKKNEAPVAAPSTQVAPAKNTAAAPAPAAK